MMIFRARWVLTVCLFIVGGCTTLQMLTHEQSPREVYLNGLKRSNLNQSPMVLRWQSAGEPTRHDSVFVDLPFSETGFFSASEPQARFYRFEGKEGQVVSVKGYSRSKEKGRLFIDLFSLADRQWKIVSSADTSGHLSKELEKNAAILLRIQPELLVNMSYSVTIGTAPSLIIPVKGASNKDIGSFYEDTRLIDGKKRKHEGVDIFAKKGTFVIAPTDGFISRVTTNTLGGKVIWMKDSKRAPSYYFAHLDSQIVKPGTNVRQGDVLGTVGNTGNAKFTPSHLHFGVYLASSIDPIAYIRTVEDKSQLKPDTLFKTRVFRVSQKAATLQAGPSRKFHAREQLKKDTWINVIAKSNDKWYRVLTADNREGFIEQTNAIPAEKGNRFIIKNSTTLLTEAAQNSVPMTTLSGPVEGLAIYKNFRYVRTSSGLTGWIDIAAL